MIRVDLHRSDVEEVQRRLGATADAVADAGRLAAKEIADRIAAGVRRRVRSVYPIPLRKGGKPILMSRVQSFRGANGEYDAKVFVGLNPVSASVFGRVPAPKRPQPGGGVCVGKMCFPGAFTGRIGGRVAVLERVGRKRLPIRHVTLDWGDAGRAALEAEAARVSDFPRVFERILKAKVAS